MTDPEDLVVAYLLGHSRGKDAADASGDGLDALLNGVHPEADVSVHEFMGKWRGVVTVRDYSEQQGNIQYTGTGPTRMLAIRNAVAAGNSDRAGEGVGDGYPD